MASSGPAPRWSTPTCCSTSMSEDPRWFRWSSEAPGRGGRPRHARDQPGGLRRGLGPLQPHRRPRRRICRPTSTCGRRFRGPRRSWPGSASSTTAAGKASVARRSHDFFIGAHAAVSRPAAPHPRRVASHRTYFPGVDLVAPPWPASEERTRRVIEPRPIGMDRGRRGRSGRTDRSHRERRERAVRRVPRSAPRRHAPPVRGRSVTSASIRAATAPETLDALAAADGATRLANRRPTCDLRVHAMSSTSSRRPSAMQRNAAAQAPKRRRSPMA